MPKSKKAKIQGTEAVSNSEETSVLKGATVEEITALPIESGNIYSSKERRQGKPWKDRRR